jgi:hypothetical protein
MTGWTLELMQDECRPLGQWFASRLDCREVLRRNLMTRYALRTDANQSAIVEALRAAGVTVDIIGLPTDLRLAENGHFAYMEVKDGAKSPSRRKKTDVQEAFFVKYPPPEWPVFLVDSVECALRHLKVWRAGR